MYEETCYEKPFLKEVISRIDFVTPLEGLRQALPPKLAKELSRYFPISEPVDAVAQELQLKGTEVRHLKSQFKQWNFYGKEREKKLVLTANWIFVTYSRYSTYENMKAEFATVIEGLARMFPDVSASRFGLRYINIIEIPDLASPTSWKEYINNRLLGTTTFFTQPANLTRLIHIAELRYDDVEVRFQFGMPNPDYPAIMKRPQYVLDLDAYVRTAHDMRESLQYMEQAHERIQELFEGSITNKLRERMYGKQRTPLPE